jgi:hypothetical protein
MISISLQLRSDGQTSDISVNNILGTCTVRWGSRCAVVSP